MNTQSEFIFAVMIGLFILLLVVCCICTADEPWNKHYKELKAEDEWRRLNLGDRARLTRDRGED